MILIKKYPNRRLYDTSKSQYVNLEAIKDFVIGHKEFKVLDSKTDKDLTKNILLQIINDQENHGEKSLLSNIVLKELIRFYEGDEQALLREYLEQVLATFIEGRKSGPR